ncbi:MAG: radical SAM protein [Planctomycetes bacterium]|nr:radical SAM protein [Planctomycetota bacterium]
MARPLPVAAAPVRRGPAPDDPALKKDTALGLVAGVLRDGGPGFAQFAITNACNANCGFCGFAVDALPRDRHVYVDTAEALAAIDILYAQGVRYLVLVGGEPLMHRGLFDMLRHARARGMQSLICSNAALFTDAMLEQLIDAGLGSAIMSVDAVTPEVHEHNRRLPGVCDKIARANEVLRAAGVQTTASVTLSRLVTADLPRLPEFLASLGFRSVTFSYPLRSLGSSYLSFSDGALVDLTDDELLAAFDQVNALRGRIHVVNPRASVEEMKRFVRKEPQRFECYAGWKYYYLDWRLQLYRCHQWDTPMCSIWEFDGSQRVRDGCTRCMIDCYRDPSVMHHLGISLSDAMGALRRGRPLEAAGALFTRDNAASLGAILGGLGWIRRL